MTAVQYSDAIALAVLSALRGAGIDVNGDGPGALTVDHGGAEYRLTIEDKRGDRPTNAVYVQGWSADQSHCGVTIPPCDFTSSHPAYHQKCLLCHEPLGNGLPLQVFVLGPTTREGRYAHHEGKRYVPLGVLLHEQCASGQARPEAN